MKASAGPTTTLSCPYCQTHNHARCTGTVADIKVAKYPLPCACGARAHDPDVETAARMRVCQSFAVRHLPVEVNAAAYRRAER